MDYSAEVDNLKMGLNRLGLPEDAVAWLMDVFLTIHVLDNAADGDRTDRDTVENAAFGVFVRMHTNQFFQEKMAALVPTLALQVIKWSAANDAEECGRADARSYMWRAGFYDLVATCCILCGLPASAKMSLDLYGEDFADYREEFPCQRQQ